MVKSAGGAELLGVDHAQDGLATVVPDVGETSVRRRQTQIQPTDRALTP
jgi:hypothetical protein